MLSIQKYHCHQSFPDACGQDGLGDAHPAQAHLKIILGR